MTENFLDISPVEPFKIKVVEPIKVKSRQERQRALKESYYNLFSIPSKDVFIDLMTDSGTSAMSDNQWAGMMVGDESYAGSKNFYNFVNAIKGIFDFKYIIPTHQGRAAENLLFSTAVEKGMCIPNNCHFDTTRANVEHQNAEAADCLILQALDPKSSYPFKGNMDLGKLAAKIKEYGAGKIPLAMITVTNNAIGGQPVSMKNIRQTKQLLKKYGVPLYIDACRFAENAYFIKEREPGYKDKSIPSIVHEMFSYADGCTMSGKKDGLVNIGGFVATNNNKLADQLKQYLILVEGFPTYGGLARRDLEAMARGLYEAISYSYLHYRILQVKFLADSISKVGVPIVKPPGGHAVYIDAKRFLPHVPPAQFPGQALACEIYLEGGIRCCEMGSMTFPHSAGLELVRLAIPRRVYTKSHLEYVALTIANVYKRRKSIKGFKIIYEAPFLRHFTIKLAHVS